MEININPFIQNSFAKQIISQRYPILTIYNENNLQNNEHILYPQYLGEEMQLKIRKISLHDYGYAYEDYSSFVAELDKDLNQKMIFKKNEKYILFLNDLLFFEQYNYTFDDDKIISRKILRTLLDKTFEFVKQHDNITIYGRCRICESLKEFPNFLIKYFPFVFTEACFNYQEFIIYLEKLYPNPNMKPFLNILKNNDFQIHGYVKLLRGLEMLNSGIVDEIFCNFYFDNVSDLIYREAIKTLPNMTTKKLL
jgi:hypothetical protein